MDILQNFLTTGFFYTIIRVSTPLIFASLSSLIARKGGKDKEIGRAHV